VAYSNGIFKLAGLVSYGKERIDDDGFPIPLPTHFGVYTAVAKFVDWIKDNSDYTDCILSKFNLFSFILNQ